MNHNIQAQFDRKVELLLEDTRLFVFDRTVMDAALDFIIGLRLERLIDHLRLAFLRDRQTREMMIIEARLANRRDARTFRQFTQWRQNIVSRFLGVSGMNADDRENVRILFRELDRS